jgi:flagellar motor switch protein FliN/FliY
MIIDQSEIDALLQEAPAPDTPDELGRSVANPKADRSVAARPHDGPELRRILKLRVPVIVQLARRLMPISEVRDLSMGTIIEFDKSVEDKLDLLINNRQVGRGNCVKVGENFGLRITQVCSRRKRIQSLGEDTGAD